MPAQSCNSGVGSYPLRSFADSDRKSTRLNSSHSQISYAVFCLKKKNDAIRTLDVCLPLWTEGEFKPVLCDALWKTSVAHLENTIDVTPNCDCAHYGSAYHAAN